MGMREHPHSVWTLGGIPGGEGGGRPSPADIESWGRTWQQIPVSDEYLIGVAARAYGANSETASMPSLIESQRRLRVEIAQFNAAATAQVTELVSLTKAAGKQTDKVVRLTEWIIALTVILGVIALLQLLAMFAGKG